jgi:hypothetical protein
MARGAVLSLLTSYSLSAAATAAFLRLSMANAV